MTQDIRRQQVVTGVLASAVADDGTLTIAYPSGTNQAYFSSGNANAAHQLVLNENDVYEATTADTFEVTFGGSDITVTNRSGASWAAGTKYRIGLAYADLVYQFSGQKSAAITALTDSSGGTASTTLAAIGGTYSQAEVRNSVATLAAQIERLRAAMNKAGIIE
jgi:hypothetical protein